MNANVVWRMILSDAEIAALLAEQKREVDPMVLLRTFAKQPAKFGHRRHAMYVYGAAETRFQLSLRQSVLDPYDFSVILSAIRQDGALNLRRHNGTSHAHFNPIEGDRFRGAFHIHQATERYQRRGADAEHFAHVTDDFLDLATALVAMLVAGSFEAPSQLMLDS